LVSVSVSELKAKLSEHLRRVKAGETVLVTERGRAVAQLTPPPPAEDGDAGLQELAAAGVIRPGRGRLSEEFWGLPRPRDPKGVVLRALLEEREEGR
jgi:prevent-host-death family protein